jgi:hypothetical protein
MERRGEDMAYKVGILINMELKATKYDIILAI